MENCPAKTESPPRASATLLYIPYILLYSPAVPKNPDDPDSDEMVPDDEYNVSGIAITLVLVALLVDRGVLEADGSPTDQEMKWQNKQSTRALGCVNKGS